MSKNKNKKETKHEVVPVIAEKPKKPAKKVKTVDPMMIEYSGLMNMIIGKRSEYKGCTIKLGVNLAKLIAKVENRALGSIKDLFGHKVEICTEDPNSMSITKKILEFKIKSEVAEKL